MPRFAPICVLLCAFLSACGSEERFGLSESPIPHDIAPDTTTSDPLPAPERFLTSFSFFDDGYTGFTERPFYVTFNATYSDDTRVNNVLSSTVSQSCTPFFLQVGNPSIATVDSVGRVTPLGVGTTHVFLTCGAIQITSPLTIKKKSTPLIPPPETPAEEEPVNVETEEPLSPDDRYLGADDEYDIVYGQHAGFAQHLFPEILFGKPRNVFLNDVITLGFGGSVTIELNGFHPVDGDGHDFIVFENPFRASGDFVFAERGRVSVSDDGITFVTFPCDAFDPNRAYKGCAGVEPFNHLLDPLDDRAGGDHFDLADVSLDEARFIRIEDMQTCVAGQPIFPLCAEIGKKGFDLDALAIVNGRRE